MMIAMDRVKWLTYAGLIPVKISWTKGFKGLISAASNSPERILLLKNVVGLKKNVAAIQ